MPAVIDATELLVPRFARVSDYGGAWAIEPHAANALLSLARQTDIHHRHIAEANPPTMKAAADFEIAKVAGPGGGTRQIAIVSITGTLMKSVGSMSAGTSTVAARRAIRKALADPDITGILLGIDSPGGTVSGTADLAAEVAAAAKQKPTWAFIEDLGASAAYWVASQASRVYANNETALVGSIGTLVVVYDYSGAAAKEGIKALVFGTGPLKGAGTPGSVVTDEQQAYFRNLVNDSQQSFDAAVSAGRRLSAAKLADARTGGVFSAREALAKGLIDGVQSLDSTLSGLARAVVTPSGGRTAEASVQPIASAIVVKEAPRPRGSQIVGFIPGGALSDRVMSEQYRRTIRTCLAPGCFHSSLAAVKRGEAAVRLLIGHTPSGLLASTNDGSLSVWEANGGWSFCTNPATTRGREAAEYAKTLGHLGSCSPDFRINDCRQPVECDESGIPCVVVTDATILEISLVVEGAIPGACVTIS